MLELKVYDMGKEVVLSFEHSLLSLSKWEAKNKKPFLTRGQLPSSDLLDYFQDMLLSPEDVTMVYRLSPSQMEELTRYINDPMSASVAPSDPDVKKNSNDVMTSEVIYYQMVALKIPFVAETWHINRLMMLIAITAHRQQPAKKESKASALTRWQEINKKNRERFNSKG